MGPSPRSKTDYPLAWYQEVLNVGIGWHDHVGCYSKKNLKLYECFKIRESLQSRFRFIETFQGFIQIHESESDLPNTTRCMPIGIDFFGLGAGGGD